MDCITVIGLLQIATAVVTPILLIYTLLVYKGDYYSRSLGYVLVLGLLLGISAVFAVWREAGGPDCALALREACLLGAMLVVVFAMRQYIHWEIDLARKGKLLPRKKAKAARK